MSRPRSLAGALGLLTALLAAPAWGKEYGFHSPGHRRIYDVDERFDDVESTHLRRFVVEAAAGSGPEGNIAALVGLLNWPLHGLEYYAGFGLELNPSRNYTLTARYVFNLRGFRPYLGAGYLFRDVYEVGTYSHSAFLEAGYSWLIHQTYRFTLGVGVRYLVDIDIRDDSPLRAGSVDPALLADETERVFPWTPTLALRFSRAF